jgi:Tfp pilus assembly protein PilE
MKSKKTEGFTIIELMLGVVGLAIIALTVGALLVYAWMGWRRNVESVAMQQNAKVAMRIIEQGIRNANLSQVTWNASSINFTKADDLDFATAEFTADSMVTITSFNVASNAAGGINVSFSLSTASETDENTYQMTIYPRN